ncbi:MAG TPA: TIGR01777 family oxidoreductase [Cyclobacteriaceae bacterium]|nr:TIGR01777 family oxidoreductase [Cyclobacteriaceae bacterium]
MNRRILIGGGSGLIGRRLTELLTQKGYHVRHLGRTAKDGPVRTFEWDIHKQTIDERAFEGVHTVINLAGANISGHRWTDAYKKELAVSRIGSTNLIVNFLNNKPHTVTNFLSGSAVGYYGMENSPHWFVETDPPGKDFLARLVVDWEKAASHAKCNVAYIRTGIIFSDRGGALEEMAKPIKLFVGSPLGSGKQVTDWIHIDDHCRIIIHILENNLSGAFNAVAPNPATNEAITKALAKKLHKPLWAPNVPAFALRIILGEMSGAVLNGALVSSRKIETTGFKFQYPTLEAALGI